MILQCLKVFTTLFMLALCERVFISAYLIGNTLSAQAKGDDQPSLCATLIREADRHQLSMQENSWLAGTM